MSEDEPNPLHRMAREWLRMKDGIEGDIANAEAGDTEFAAGLLRTFILQAYSCVEHCRDSDRSEASCIDPVLLGYVAGLLDEALSVTNQEIPKALNLAPGHSGRPYRTAAQNEDYVCVGFDVYFTRRSKNNLEEACEDVGDRWNVSARQARRAYEDIKFAFQKRDNQ